MLDVVIKDALIYDGSLNAAIQGDVAIQGDQITHIGKVNDLSHRTINAQGAWVTPGFIDIHTHYDGQASWDQTLRPSIDHGVSTVVMGNCGVGFAPVADGGQQRLLELMEGVEEIPGAALAEGIDWRWQSFAQYMQALNAKPHSLNFMNLVPHDCLRLYAMSERAARGEAASDADLHQMQGLLREALLAGAIGFSTGRTDNHRTSLGNETPASHASPEELTALAGVLKDLPYRVMHAVSDFACMRGSELQGQRDRFDHEYALLESMAIAANKPLALTWLERLQSPQQAGWLGEAATASQLKGLSIRLQTSCRPVGVLNQLGSTFHAFMAFPSYQAIAHLPLQERALAMRSPEMKKRMLQEKPAKLCADGSAVPPIVDQLLANFDQTAKLLFPFQTADYLPDPMTSFGVQAMKRGLPALEVVYDYICQGSGNDLIYFPLFNYLTGSSKTLETMLAHPQALLSLSDAGAHVGSICDGSLPTHLLTYWAGKKLSISQAVNLLTLRNAQHLGLKDRGLLAVGMKADLNLIDPSTLALHLPQLVADLPAGGKRYIQKASGYIATFVNGKAVTEQGEIMAARPGQWIAACS
jgi:N-acyl-D-aspartate/D-glutamate deacylase